VIANIVHTLVGGKTAAKTLATDIVAMNADQAQPERRYALGLQQ
jgi:hypothetical protein